MTCIVGIVDKNTVWIGGDSAGVAGLNVTIREDRKVFKNGPMIFGFTTSFRMGQLLHYKFTPPEHPSGMSTMKYMVTDFIDEVRECFKDGGYAKEVNSVESGGCFLVGYQGRLFTIDSDFQVGMPGEWDSVGCGARYALGSLFSTKGKNPKSRIKKALEAAEYFSGGVCSPFHYVSLKS